MEPGIIQMKQKAYGELDDTERWLADLVHEGICVAMPFIAGCAEARIEMQLALHPHDGEPFFLLKGEHGQYLGCSPVNEAADALLHAEVPGIEPGVTGASLPWLQGIAWQPVIGIHLRRDARGAWHPYEPERVH